jgi:hypothetical protein
MFFALKRSSIGDYWSGALNLPLVYEIVGWWGSFLTKLGRQHGVRTKKPPSIRRTVTDGGKGHRVGWRLPSKNLTTQGVVNEIEK